MGFFDVCGVVWCRGLRHVQTFGRAISIFIDWKKETYATMKKQKHRPSEPDETYRSRPHSVARYFFHASSGIRVASILYVAR